jgi:hypothetical protein
MRMRTRGRGLAVLLAAAGLLVAAPTASANSAECTFNGVAGTIDPDIPGIPTLGGSGLYTFSGGAQCVYGDTRDNPNVPGDESPTVYPTPATIETSGEYANDVCSTGWAFSDWGMPPDDPDRPGVTDIDFHDPRANDIDRMRYMIRFTAGNGHLVARDINGNLTSHGTGQVEILPSAGSSCAPGGSVSSFDVTGAFSLEY